MLCFLYHKVPQTKAYCLAEGHSAEMDLAWTGSAVYLTASLNISLPSLCMSWVFISQDHFRMGIMALCWTEGRRHACLPHVVMKVKDFKRKMTGLWHLPVGWPGSVWLRGGWVYGQCPRLHARRPGAAGSNPCCQPRLWTPQTGAALVRLPWETDTSIHVQINISTDWRMDRGSRSRNLKSINICHISLENT